MRKRTTYRYGRTSRRRRSRRGGARFGVLLLVCIAVVYAAYACLRPIPYHAQLVLPRPDTGRLNVMAWPSAGQFAVGIEGQGVVAVSPHEHVAPMASVTKLVTALAVLEKRPLKPGGQGGMLHFTQADVAVYQSVIARDGVGIGVQPGQTMTERQALEAMLLASANNIAISLSSWAFGSEKAYADYANDMLRRHGFTQTHITGASGLDADTVSTPGELVKLAELSTKSPIILEITALPQTEISGVGPVYNISHISALSSDVYPLKVGLTDEAGACFVFWTKPAGSDTRVYGAITGQQDFRVLKAYVNAFVQQTVPDNFVQLTLVRKGDPVATYIDGSGARITASSRNDIVVPHWRGQEVGMSLSANPALLRLEVRTGAIVNRYDLVSSRQPQFAVTWRLLHPV